MEIWLNTLGNMIDVVAQLLLMLIIIQFIIGMLFTFNVINSRNQFLGAFYDAINRFLEPVLRPIRKRLPDTGAIDFSPLVLIVLIQFLRMIVDALSKSVA